MCNNCDCENFDRCSIVGYLPHGFCCNSCDNYNEVHSCPTYVKINELKVYQVISNSLSLKAPKYIKEKILITYP